MLECALLLPLMLVKAHVLRSQIQAPNQRIDELKKLTNYKGRRLFRDRKLTSSDGNRLLSRAVLFSFISNIHSLSDSGQLPAGLGLVPGLQNSNRTEQYGPIPIADRANNRYSSYLANFCRSITLRSACESKITLVHTFQDTLTND